MLLEKKDSNFENQIFILQNKLKNNLFDEVIQRAKSLLKKHRHERKILNGISVLYNIISLAYQSKLDYNNSIKIMEEALKLNPKNIYYLNNMAISQHKNNDFVEAEKYFKRALKINPNYINVLNNFGNLKKDLDKVDEAIKYYEKSVSINKNILITNYNLSSMYIQKGEYNKAIKNLQKILEINPKFTTADRTLSIITKYEKNNKHFLDMKEKKINLKLNNSEMIELNFALGKAYEDLKDYKNAFTHIKEANDSKKKVVNYNIQKDIDLFKNIKNDFKTDFKIKNIYNKKKLIFIVGMPRSGTTLAEQIISSHKNVYGAGELVFLSDMIKEEFFNKNNKNYNLKKFNDLQNEYLNKISLIDNSNKSLTDKAPLNFRWIGFITIMFPNSKIINCKRNSLDNCWSIYKNNFDAGLNFSFNLTDLGKFYKLYEDLIYFWKSKYPKKIYDLEYENLINNQENETKKILDFCELEWDPNCLKHYDNKRLIKTVSTVQARKPIYKTSIKLSNSYSEYLNELKTILNK